MCAITGSHDENTKVDGDPVSTGIFKEPVAGRVMLRTLNLDGDRQADLSVMVDQVKQSTSIRRNITTTGSKNCLR